MLLSIAGCDGSKPTPAAPAPTIVCLGDSITLGISRSSGANEPGRMDKSGGYPGRLQRLLGSRAIVVKRAVGGTTTRHWLAEPASDGGLLWKAMASTDHRLDGGPPASATSVARAVVELDHPDVVIVLLGANDLLEVARSKDDVEAVVGRLRTLREQMLPVARTVLVSTVLPSNRDPAPLRDALNAKIRTVFPDHLSLGESFRSAAWEQLLGDNIHPNEGGYEVIARLLAEELVRRGLVAR